MSLSALKFIFPFINLVSPSFHLESPWGNHLSISHFKIKHQWIYWDISILKGLVIDIKYSFYFGLTRHVCFNYKIETTSVCATWIRSWSEKYTIQINIKLHVICRWVYYSAVSTNKTRITKCKFDGSNQQSIITDNNPGIIFGISLGIS